MHYDRIYESDGGGSVDLHSLHGVDELPHNVQVALLLADYGYCVELLPTIPQANLEDRLKWLPDVVHPKNPDLRIDGYLIGDIKTPHRDVDIKKSTINNFIYSCAKQKVKIAVINLAGRNYSIQDIKKGVIGALQPDRNKSIEEVWVITKDRRLFQLARDEVFDESIYEQLNEL